MTERQLTLIDVDENPFVVSLRDDRIQMSGVDSRPELAAGELRVFATALFGAYAAAPLIARLEQVRAKLSDVQGQLAFVSGGRELLSALHDALHGVAVVHQGLTGMARAVDAAPAPPVRLSPPLRVVPPPRLPGPPGPREPPVIPLSGRRRKPPGGTARDGGAYCGWGWRAEPASHEAADAPQTCDAGSAWETWNARDA